MCILKHLILKVLQCLSGWDFFDGREVTKGPRLQGKSPIEVKKTKHIYMLFASQLHAFYNKSIRCYFQTGHICLVINNHALTHWWRPSFTPIQNSVQGEQFRWYKSPKGVRANERLTDSTVPEKDLQNHDTVFYPSWPPGSIDEAKTNLRFFVFHCSISLFSRFLSLVF